MLAALVLAAIAAPEANQGVAAGPRHVYAVDNSTIGKYDKRTGKRVAAWKGDPAAFPHLNSCALAGRELVCAASNYPAVPMVSTVEFFDAQTLAHRRTERLGQRYGSLTVLDRRGQSWWAVFANYDGRGGQPGRDHRATLLLEFDDAFRARRVLTFPETVLARFAPRSCSGGAWGADGLFYASGHDRKEVYALRVPAQGTVLEHVATLAVSTPGQAIDWDPSARRALWTIDRAARRLVRTVLPPAKR